MSDFFRSFPSLLYQFGNGETTSLFQNISAFNSLVDEIKDDVTFHTTVTINDGERADTLSHKLYGTDEYYWTFYFLNDDIRESGWPVEQSKIFNLAKKIYPNRTLITRADISRTFLPGDEVRGVISGARGIVVKRYLDLGQIIVRKLNTSNYRTSELIQPFKPDGSTNIGDRITIESVVDQFNSIHHYENASKEFTDIDPFTQAGADASALGLTPITYLDRMIEKNDDLREIKVFLPDIVGQIQTEFVRLMRDG
jgi:hypothetical protein